MNVISMMHKVHLVANSMIREPALPDFLAPTNDTAEFVRIRALDQLHSPLNGRVARRCQEQMNMLGHDNESLQEVTAFATIAVNRFQEETDISLNGEQFSTVVRREGHEVSSRRGNEPSRLQERTSAAESRTSLETLNWHEWNSCPSRWFSHDQFRFGTNASTTEDGWSAIRRLP
jgi:hypothetical protein